MTNPSTPQQDMPDGMELVHYLRQQLVTVKETFPDWYAEYEDCDPVTADSNTLQVLLASAPDRFVAGLIAGIMMFRQQLAILTGRSF